MKLRQRFCVSVQRNKFSKVSGNDAAEESDKTVDVVSL